MWRHLEGRKSNKIKKTEYYRELHRIIKLSNQYIAKIFFLFDIFETWNFAKSFPSFASYWIRIFQIL